MKKLLLITLISCMYSIQSKACVETHPDSLWITTLADSVNCELMIQVANLNMYGGNPNEFCSCGINDQISELGQLEYVVFVDATTLLPVAGFSPYELNELTGDSWEYYDTAANYDWNGFIAIVNEQGLVAGQEVILWIKLSSTSDSWWWEEFGLDCSEEEGIRSFLEYQNVSFGTDMWDPISEELSDHHLSISLLIDENNTYEHIIISPEEMEAMDQSIIDHYNSVEDFQFEGTPVIYPNPVGDEMRFGNLPQWVSTITVINLEGKKVMSFAKGERVDCSELAKGLYHVQFMGTENQYTTRILKD